MELKSWLKAHFGANVDSSNRTFMELKYGSTDLRTEPGQGSNRTFMELKSFLNFCVMDKKSSSNRTFMELKLSDTRLMVFKLLF